MEQVAYQDGADLGGEGHLLSVTIASDVTSTLPLKNAVYTVTLNACNPNEMKCVQTTVFHVDSEYCQIGEVVLEPPVRVLYSVLPSASFKSTAPAAEVQ